MTRLLRFRLTDEQLPTAWQSALSTVGGIFLACVVLAVLHATGGVG